MSSFLLDEHWGYLSDAARMSVYRQAISEVVKAGSVVLDLGAGTGILGLLACQAGASRVYSIEVGPIISLARDLCKANGFEDRVRFIRGLSTAVELPERVDVVVCDQIGAIGYEAGIIEYLADARQRFLKPGGTLIPARLRFEAAPIEDEELDHQVHFWNNSTTGFNLKPAHVLSANSTYATQFKREALLGDPVELGTLGLGTETRSLQFQATSVIARAGVLHGVGVWFHAELSPGVVMTNSPVAAAPIKRRQVFLPIERGMPVKAGESVQIRMQVISTEMLVKWNVTLLAADGGQKAAFSHSTFHGVPLVKEDLLKTQPHFVPVLSHQGQARRTVLELCDGAHTLAEIEKETYTRHPDVFRSADKAAAFVAAVVGRFTR